MAGLISGIAGNLGGSSANTDRGNFLSGVHDINNVYNWAMPFGEQQARTGQATTATGVNDIGAGAGFFRKLAGGDRSAALSAVAPQTNAAIAQNDAEKRQEASMGTARGGGAAGFNQQRDTDLMSKVDNMLFGARTGAAAGEIGAGQSEAGVGLGETNQGLQGANLAERSGQDIAGESRLSRMDSEQIHQAHVKALSKSFEDLLSGLLPQSWLSKLGSFGMSNKGGGPA